MRKHNYRSVDVKKIDRQKLLEKIAGQAIVIGVDVAKEEMYATLMDDCQEGKLTIKWHHPSETMQFVDLVTCLPARSVEAAMEPSGTYGDSLRYQLLEAGCPVYRVSPKRSHDAAEVYDGVPSIHDAKSAAIIAKLHLDGASELWPLRSARERGLAALNKVLKIHDEAFHRNLNRLEAEIARHWPEVTEYLSLDRASLLELLIEFGGPDKVSEQPGKARSLLRRVGGNLLKQEKIEAVIKSAQATLGVPLIDEERRYLRCLARETRRSQQEADKARLEFERDSRDELAVAAMSPVIGKLTAAVLYSCLGDPANYDSASSYLKACGLNLKERSSGKHKGELKIAKRGPSEVRRYLYLAVLRLIQQDAVFNAWYIRKIKRDGGKHKGRALVALMRKLVKGLWHVSQGEVFESGKLFNLRRLHLSAA